MAKSIKEDIECYWFHKWNNWLIQIIPFKSIVWRKFRKFLFRSFQFICRVPQGSILGPSMFLIYVNEMLQAVKSNLFLNSDDSCLWCYRNWKTIKQRLFKHLWMVYGSLNNKKYSYLKTTPKQQQKLFPELISQTTLAI